jgi:hypothetical protein
LSAPKREKQNKPKSEVVQKLIDEKRKEKGKTLSHVYYLHLIFDSTA